MLKENSIILLYYSCFFSSSNVVGSMESGKNLVTRPFLKEELKLYSLLLRQKLQPSIQIHPKLEWQYAHFTLVIQIMSSFLEDLILEKCIVSHIDLDNTYFRQFLKPVIAQEICWKCASPHFTGKQNMSLTVMHL